jgi:hypothetical protein
MPDPQAPRSLDELRALEFKRSELLGQLNAATGRRGALIEELRATDAASRPAIAERLKLLDARIARLEEETERVSDQIANAPPHVLSSTTEVNPALIAERLAEKIVPIAGIFSLFVLAPIAFAIARLIWRRATAAGSRRVAGDPTTHQKLEQLQQSMDTIAIEVERISESQRFLSRVMNDRQIGGGAAEPVRVANKAGVPSERE